MLVLSVPTLVSTGTGSRMIYSVSSLWYFVTMLVLVLCVPPLSL